MAGVIQWYRGVEGQEMENRDHQGEEKHQEHLDLDNNSSDQFIVIINLFSSPWPELSYCSHLLEQ